MNPLTMLADRARCIAYDYGTRTSRIDVHQRVRSLFYAPRRE